LAHGSRIPLQRLCRLSGVDRTSLNPSQTVAIDPSAKLLLWHPGQTHALNDAPALLAKRRIIAKWNTPQATNGESWIKRKRLVRGSARLIQFSEMGKRSGEVQMRYGIVRVTIQTSTKPYNCFGVGS